MKERKQIYFALYLNKKKILCLVVVMLRKRTVCFVLVIVRVFDLSLIDY